VIATDAVRPAFGVARFAGTPAILVAAFAARGPANASKLSFSSQLLERYKAAMPSERFGRRARAQLEALRKLAPPTRDLSWRQVARLDRERLWWFLRGLDRAALLRLVVRALAEVPANRLESVLHDHARPGDIGARSDEPEPSLRSDVEQFCQLARTGHYFEEIPYRGSEQSRGTYEFVARCSVLFDRCIAEGERTPNRRELRASFELLLDLMRRIDECQEDIVAFTDEGGSWQCGVVWTRVLPAYFRCLAQTANHEEYDATVEQILASFARHGSLTRAEKERAAEEAWRGRERRSTDSP
jgi:hypothetical protein